MKHCYKHAILCGVIGLVLIFFSLKVGIPAYLTPFVVPLMMVSCCVLPMILLMFSGKRKDASGGCCAGQEKSKLVPAVGAELKEKPRCCH